MIELTDTASIYTIADWIEFRVIYNNKALSKSRIFSLLRTVDDTIDETTIDSAMNELVRRSELYGDVSPFVLERKSVKPKVRWSNRPELAMCLIFSIRGVVKKRGKDDGTKLFEILSSEAIKSYLNGEAEVIGFPNKRRLKEQIECISRKTCERLGMRTPYPKDKDKGVDIIAWKSHSDKRSNQIVLLLQCGAGIHFSKKKSISLPAWKDFVNWSAEPIKGIMIPIIPSEEQWIEIRDDYNLIFDRVRIYRAIHNRSSSNRQLRKHILDWCRTALN